MTIIGQGQISANFRHESPIRATYFGREVDSNGYAPFVNAAITSGSGEEAMNAANIIRDCLQVTSNIDRAKESQSEQTDRRTYEGYSKIIEYYEYQSRSCQTLTSDNLNSRISLLKKAMERGLTGAHIYLLQNILAA